MATATQSERDAVSLPTIDSLSPKEAAARLSVSVAVVHKERQSGKLKAFAVGSRWRFKVIDIEAYIEQQKFVPIREDVESSNPLVEEFFGQ